MTRAFTAAMMLACLLAGAPASAQPDASAASATGSVRFARAVLALPVGSVWISLQSGLLLCSNGSVTRTWASGRVALDVAPYASAFKTELERAGFKVVTPGDNLFDAEAGSTDYEAAVIITDQRVEGCIDGTAHSISEGKVRGTGSMTVDWQLYILPSKNWWWRMSAPTAPSSWTRPLLPA
jgi:hypothetical protein